MHVGTRHPIWQVIHESLHTRGSGLNTQATTTLIGSDAASGAAARDRFVGSRGHRVTFPLASGRHL